MTDLRIWHENLCIECGAIIPCLCNMATSHACPACMQIAREAMAVPA